MTKLLYPSAALSAALLCAAVRPSSADVVFMSNDVSMEGILEQNPDGTLQLRVSVDGTIFLDTGTVTGIERQSRDQNDALLRRWEENKAKADQEERAQAAFAAAQKAKGLIFFEEEWMKPEEADRKIQLERLFLEKEAAENTPEPPEVIYLQPEVSLVTLGNAGAGRGRREDRENRPLRRQGSALMVQPHFPHPGDIYGDASGGLNPGNIFMRRPGAPHPGDIFGGPGAVNRVKTVPTRKSRVKERRKRRD